MTEAHKTTSYWGWLGEGRCVLRKKRKGYRLDHVNATYACVMCVGSGRRQPAPRQPPRPVSHSLRPTQKQEGNVRSWRRSYQISRGTEETIDAPLDQSHSQISGLGPMVRLYLYCQARIAPNGAHPEQLDRRVRSELGDLIVPSTQHNLPVVPNSFLELKGPGNSVAVAKRQALYAVAFGARVFNAA
jgi:hypothetical protein